MRAQGALEYLIIIAAVLGISAVVVLFVTGAFTGSSSGADISKCRLAVANCQRDLTLGLGTSCMQCDDACKVSSTGKEVLFGATAACKAGKTSSIAKGLTVAVVQDASCTCAWTVGGCSTWWKDRLVERDFNVEFIGTSVLQDANAMKAYRAILNPYGEFYLDYGGNQYAVLDNVREYVRQGGYWFEYGGYPFYYSCSTSVDPYSSGSARVCFSIVGPAAADTRTITSYGSRVVPGAPASITGDRRPSSANDFTSYGGCNALASGATYNPIYLNTVNNYAGPVAHCYGGGCIVRSDKFTSNDQDIATIYAYYLRTTVF